MTVIGNLNQLNFQVFLLNTPQILDIQVGGIQVEQTWKTAAWDTVVIVTQGSM